MKYRLKGSFTIEVALLMPFILGIIVLIIYLSFYCYDIAFFNQSAYMSALRGANIRMTDNDLAYAETSIQSESLLKGKVLAKADIAERISVDFSKVTVSYNMSMRVPLQGLLDNITGENQWGISATRYAKRLRPAVFIRLCEKMKALKES